MNIAHLLPHTASFPVTRHNGRYEWAMRLIRLQAENGPQVTVYAAPGSSDENANIIWRSSAYDFGNKTKNNIALIKTALQDDNHDIYHSHFDYMHYFLADSTTKPVLFTQHWFPNQDISNAAHFNVTKNVLAVPATQHMAAENNKLGIASTDFIRQGIDLSLFQPKEPVSDRLIFVGRITRNKGVLEAVKIALATNQKLDIIGKINESDKEYWEQILPLVDNDQIKYLGPKTHEEVADIMAHAKALIFPSQAPEASPQVPIEAQACGLPVIISNVGSTAEWVDHGKSGFVVETEAEYIDAVHNLDTIDRNYCREFASLFDISKMFESYERLYAQLTTS